MSEPLPEALGWLDAKKRQVIAEIATALSAPETAGPNIWGALKDLAGNLSPQLQDTGDPVQNSRNLMSGLVGVGSIHSLPPAKIPTYGVTELPQTLGLMSKFLSPSQQAIYQRLIEAGHPQEKALSVAKMQP